MFKRFQAGVTGLALVLGSGVVVAPAPATAASTTVRYSSHSSTAGYSPVARTTGTVAGSVKAFDSAATISDPAWFADMYRQGYRLYVLHSTAWGSCVPWENAQAQLKMALDAGLKIAAYTRDPNCWQGGIEAAGPYAGQLQFFALDVETDPGVPVTQAMVNGVTSMGVRPVIYSGSGMWPAIMGGDNTALSNVALWDSDISAPLDPNAWVANVLSPVAVQYGGWNTDSTQRKLVQQAIDVNVGGIAVDLDSVVSSFLQ